MVALVSHLVVVELSMRYVLNAYQEQKEVLALVDSSTPQGRTLELEFSIHLLLLLDLRMYRPPEISMILCPQCQECSFRQTLHLELN